MHKRKAAMEKFFDDTWRLGLFTLQAVLLAIIVVLGIRVIQLLPPVQPHSPGEIIIPTEGAPQ